MCKKFVDNEDFSENIRMIASLNFTLVSVCEELNNINKNLEKIANKDFIQVGEISRTINKGDFIKENYVYPPDNNKVWAEINKYEPVQELNLRTKESHVDKNIILD